MIIQQHGKALGTQVVFTLNTTESLGKVILLEIRNFLQEFEDRFSRFLENSEISMINQNSGKWLKVSSEMVEFMKVSNQMQQLSGGAYNPFILPELQSAGYFRSLAGDYGDSRNLDMKNRTFAKSDFRVQIDNGKIKIPENSAFETGGLGKGYALDKIAEIIEKSDCFDYWISLGGDIIARGFDENNQKWIAVLDMIDGCPKVSIGGNERQALATSSIDKRRGENWHHLINPWTNSPHEAKIVTASVVAKKGIWADVAAKSIILLDDFEENQPPISELINQKCIKSKG